MYLKRINNERDQDLNRLYKIDDVVEQSTHRINSLNQKQ